MIEKVAEAMIAYDQGDIRRINHFMKVFGYCQIIGKLEKLDEKTQSILEMAALTHDIGIKVCEEKYGHCAGSLQEKEGPDIARNMLVNLNVASDVIERVCYLIGLHHTYTNIEGMDYQILVEADFLVNLDEKNSSKEAIINAKNKIFKTASGISCLEKMFLKK